MAQFLANLAQKHGKDGLSYVFIQIN